uniref:FBD domain-containing protein n=1 Tax=Arundo donax TaxID=35708 RepID=A0A0A9AFZ7_ARUDO
MHGYGDVLQRLRVMKLINIYMSGNELHFIKLILSKAQVLENFSIVHHAWSESSSLKACIEIMKFKRASPLPQISYKAALIF